MAFTVRHLAVHAFSNGATLWTYKNEFDDIDAMCSDNYFREAKDMLSVMDVIILTTPTAARLVMVNSANKNAVTVVPFT